MEIIEEIEAIITNYPNRIAVSQDESFNRFESYGYGEREVAAAIDKIGIETILDNKNYVKAISTLFNKRAYFSFIRAVNKFYGGAIKEKNTDKLSKLDFLKSEEYAKGIISKRYEKDDFITYSIAFFEDVDIVNNVINVSANNLGNEKVLPGAIQRGLQDLSGVSLGYDKFYMMAKNKYSNVMGDYELGDTLAPVVKAEFIQKIINNVVENLKGDKFSMIYLAELSNKLVEVNEEQLKESLIDIKTIIRYAEDRINFSKQKESK